jgi:hypothetical protein
VAHKSSVYVDALKIPLALAGFLGAAFAAYYFVYVASERDYLTGRNFRLLATMGERIDAAVENDQKVLTNLRESLAHLAELDQAGNHDAVTRELKNTAEFIPILRMASLAIDASRPGSEVRMTFIESGGRSEWVRRADDTAPPQKGAITVKLDLDALLAPLLDGELQRTIFDAVFVAAGDGRVIFFSGDPRLRIAHLDKLTVDSKNADPLDFARVTKASAMVNVRVVGSRYTLLMQPCCGRIVRADAAAPQSGQGWILGGLTAQRTLTAASSTIPFSTMTLLLAFLLLALLSWPFLKLRFIGEAQRVRVYDVVLVGVGALLGVALITVVTLDLFATRRLNTVLDDQLARLAAAIKAQAQEEVTAAYAELTRLEDAFIGTSDATSMVSDLVLTRQNFTEYPFFESLAFLDHDGRQRGKLAFDSFVTPRIDAGEREYFTYWRASAPSTPAFLQPLQSATTGTREAVLSKRAPRESSFDVVTMTIPMHALIDPVIVPGFGFAVIDRGGRVLFHSDPDHNLSENFFVEADGNRRLRALVAARHEEWADLKYWGDDHRVLVTPFDLTIGYGKESTRIGVFEGPWALVTFYDKDLARTVNVEWLVVVAALLTVYGGIYVAICLAVLFLRPQYRAPWLWPDPARSRVYLDAIPPVLILLSAIAVSLEVLAPADLLGVAALLPFVAWILVYRLVAQSAEGDGWTRGGVIAVSVVVLFVIVLVGRGLLGWRGVLLATTATVVAWTVAAIGRRANRRSSSPLTPPVNVSYGLVAGLFLVLIAVMPAAAFFKAAYDIELENFVKYGQLQVALDRQQHETEANETLARRIKNPESLRLVRALRNDRWRWWGAYDTFFFCTQPVTGGAPMEDAGDGEGCRRFAGVLPSAATPENEALPAVVEELLPFYSESSVHFRELVHDRAADQSWGWSRSGPSLFLHLPATGPATFASVKPPLVARPFSEQSSLSDLLWLALVATGVVGVVVWVVRFVMHTVFVIDVLEPLWSESDDRLDRLGIARPHLFVVSGEQHLDERQVLSYCRMDLADAPADDPAQERWFAEHIVRLARNRGDVLITHCERRLQDRVFNRRKLALLEHVIRALGRTVVIVSAVPPGNFFAAAGVSRDTDEADARRRWADLLSRFTILPARPLPVRHEPETAVLAGWPDGGWRELVWRVNAIVFARSAPFVEGEARDPVVGRFWKAVLPNAWHPDRPALDLSQLLVEVGERAESFYREVWATCTQRERLVLGQLAQEGLVNEKTKRTVRLLMLRGLVRRQPHFVLMNETFRQFVRSSDLRGEVDALEEQSSGAWDFIRWPFFIILTGGLGFFFATQQELGKTLLGVLTAAATIVPTVVKMASSLGERRSST